MPVPSDINFGSHFDYPRIVIACIRLLKELVFLSQFPRFKALTTTCENLFRNYGLVI